MISTRRLGPGDEALLATVLASGDQFERDPDDPPDADAVALAPADLASFLADPTVRYWLAVSDDGPGVAACGGHVVGELFVVLHRVTHVPGREVLLYEIGVHHERRRQGIGRLLLSALDRWAGEAGLTSIWVLADDTDAAAFYAACGYAVGADQPTYLERTPPSVAPS